MTASPRELEGRWCSTAILKRDIFSTIERGCFYIDNREVDAVLRRLDAVPWWSRPLAKELLRCETRRLRLPARSISHRRFCLRANDFSSAAGSMACRCMSPSPMVTQPISDLQKRRCVSFIAPGLRTTISPRGRTGSTQADAPISPTFSLPRTFAAAAGCSGSRVTKICATCSNTNGVTRRMP